MRFELHRSRVMIAFALMLAVLATPLDAFARSEHTTPEAVHRLWNRMTLNLVRHTPTYSPPVASRAFAYLAVIAWEAYRAGQPELQTVTGQLNAAPTFPRRLAAANYDEAAVLHGALSAGVRTFFENTGPSGQNALESLDRKLLAAFADEVEPEMLERSLAFGKIIASTVQDWSRDDGGAQIANLGFPATYSGKSGPAAWKPTNTAALQQMPLLPLWGKNRPFAMDSGNACPLPAPPEYGEVAGSAFHAEALEVYTVSQALTEEQRAIARFWSDDAMLSPTPPGHWLSILMQIAERESLAIDKRLEAQLRLTIAMADAFIGCWYSKYEYDLVRPVTYIRKLIDANWQPLLITPPFPEYPSGHSTQSGAAAAALEAFFGPDFAFEDTTHERDGLALRNYASFADAAREAALSRLYGGIHFRAAIDRVLEQGQCIGAFANQLVLRK